MWLDITQSIYQTAESLLFYNFPVLHGLNYVITSNYIHRSTVPGCECPLLHMLLGTLGPQWAHSVWRIA